MRYPVISLPSAKAYIDKLVLHGRSAIYTRDNLFELMQLSGTSGHAANVMSALIQYGLIERTGDRYRFSENALRSFASSSVSEKYIYRREAFLRPSLFRAIYSKLGETPLQSSHRELLSELGVAESAIDRVVKAYNDSLAFIGATANKLLANQILGLDISEPQNDPLAITTGDEQALMQYLRENWERLWPGYILSGTAVQTTDHRIDFLGHNEDKQAWIVCELKRDQAQDAAIGQLIRSMAHVRNQLAHAADRVEGVLLCRDDSPIEEISSIVPHLSLIKYKLSFKFTPTSHEVLEAHSD